MNSSLESSNQAAAPVPVPVTLHGNKRVLCWTDPNGIEVEARQQLHNVAALPFVYHHVAALPDCHLGKGATVGSVIPTLGAIVPAAVGVDIGCNVLAVRTPFSAEDLNSLPKLREGIERRIPLSPGNYNQKLTESAQERVEQLLVKADTDYSQFADNWASQLGSLGGGNHFIEITVDEEDRVWAFLHSGSRGIGNKIANHYIRAAKDMARRWHIPLPDPDLAYLPEGEKEFSDYIRDLHWAQEFALLNCAEMMDRVLMELADHLLLDWRRWPELDLERIQCQHNFSRKEHHFCQSKHNRNNEKDGNCNGVWLTRKGAISAKTGEMGLIPGSMGTKSYVVRGLGDVPSFQSSPHGAGRRFSRSEARRRFNLTDFLLQTDGVECRKEEAFIDEIPAAYKDVDEVMTYASTLVEPVHTLRQVICVKGT